MANDRDRPGEQSVIVSADGVALPGDLSVPPGACGIVLFAHGSGSSRHSPRNRQVARALQSARLGTLLFDLLTPEEEHAERWTRPLRFDIPVLARRLAGAARWLRRLEPARGLPLGYFGASTGAGAALMATAQHPQGIAAIVSRGGRPDLAGPALDQVSAPTLFIVGGADEQVLELNQSAFVQLRAAEKRLYIVTGATHLFEEPGALEEVTQVTVDWFARFLRPPVEAARGPADRHSSAGGVS